MTARETKTLVSLAPWDGPFPAAAHAPRDLFKMELAPPATLVTLLHPRATLANRPISTLTPPQPSSALSAQLRCPTASPARFLLNAPTALLVIRAQCVSCAMQVTSTLTAALFSPAAFAW